MLRKESTLKRNFQKLRESPGVRYESVGRGFEFLPSHQAKSNDLPFEIRCKSWNFLFYNNPNTAGMCLACALWLKKCLAVCLTACLVLDARRGRQSADRPAARNFTTSNKKGPQTRAVAVWGLCHAAILLRSTESCSRSAAPGGCCPMKMLVICWYRSFALLAASSCK